MKKDYDLSFDSYQDWMSDFMRHPSETLFYPALKLNGEAGEVAEKVGKLWRDRGIEKIADIPQEDNAEIVKELGDVLWYISSMAKLLGVSLSDVAKANITKLESRKQRGVLSGSGDNR